MTLDIDFNKWNARCRDLTPEQIFDYKLRSQFKADGRLLVTRFLKEARQRIAAEVLARRIIEGAMK